MRVKMIDEKNNRVVWADGAVPGNDLTYYDAWIYDAEHGGDPIGYVTWPTVDGWEDHVWNYDKNACAVEDCSGWCEDESNACDWNDENATFHYYNII